MLRQIIIPDKDTPPPAEIVHDEKLDDVLRAYIAMLAERYPFSVELKVDENLILEQLAEFWPEDTEWSAQAYDVWNRIDHVVRSVAAITDGPNAILHILASPSPLKPAEMLEIKGPVALATFDSVQGILHQCLLANGDEPLRSLDALSIPSGLMIMCQPLTGVIEKPVDNRDVAHASGDNIYSGRARDKILRVEQQQTVAEEKALPLPVEPARPAAPQP